MNKDYQQIDWDERTAEDCCQIIRLAAREELDRFHDLTTVALVSATSLAAAKFVVRQAGVVAGLPAVQLVVQQWNLAATLHPTSCDGAFVSAGTSIAHISGSARDLLTAERLMLNLLGRLSGIATLTRRFVEQVAGTPARIYDTRKTTPGWRRLEKYAVRCGQGRNHRSGLFDAVLIKDNHLAQAVRDGTVPGMSPAQAVQQVREFLAADGPDRAETLVEVEVATLDQLDQVLAVRPDIILLDNMSEEQLREAVRRRNTSGAATELEASGGITLVNVHAVAASGVDRISVGALTHSAPSLDIGLDWET